MTVTFSLMTHDQELKYTTFCVFKRLNCAQH